MTIRNIFSRKVVDPLILRCSKDPSWPWYSELGIRPVEQGRTAGESVA
jgi:hypothetical protein